RGRAGGLKRDARAGPRRSRRGGYRGEAHRPAGAPAGMSVLIAILGLGFLILIHEAGHFFTALAVGMRPRKFYIGFPPPLVRSRRKGIEYGIGSVPLGGYVKIPGMHRPAPSDVDLHFARAIGERPELFAATSVLRRRLEEGDLDGAAEELRRLE